MADRGRTIPGPAGKFQLTADASFDSGAAERSGDGHGQLQEKRYMSPAFWREIEKIVFGGANAPDDSWRPALNTIAHVLDGLCDLKVPHMVVVVEEVRRNEHLGSSIVTLKDASGAAMDGILWDRDASFIAVGLGGSIRAGCIVYLQNVPILVQRAPFARYLVLHRSAVRRVVSVAPGDIRPGT